MKFRSIIVLFTLSVIVKGTLLTAAVRPIILSFGAAFVALDLDVQPILNVNLMDF